MCTSKDSCGPRYTPRLHTELENKSYDSKMWAPAEVFSSYQPVWPRHTNQHPLYCSFNTASNTLHKVRTIGGGGAAELYSRAICIDSCHIKMTPHRLHMHREHNQSQNELVRHVRRVKASWAFPTPTECICWEKYDSNRLSTALQTKVDESFWHTNLMVVNKSRKE